jgi:autotransporter-associated beta strand protein
MSNNFFIRSSSISMLHARRTPSVCLAGGLAAIVFALPHAALGADRTWDGGGILNFNYNWSNNANWIGGGGISPLDSLFFGGTKGLTNNNNTTAGTQYNGLTFNSGAGAFRLQGNRIKLGGNVTNNSTAIQTIDFDMELAGADRTFNAASGDLVINGELSGSHGIVKTGSGTLFLGDFNTHTGGVSISGGTVNVANATSLGTGQVSFSGDGTLELGNSAYVYNNAINISAGSTATISGSDPYVSLAGQISGAGTFEKSGSGTISLLGANTHTGGTTLTSGKLKLYNDLALGGSTNALTVNGGVLDLRDRDVYVGALSGTGGVITTTGVGEGLQLGTLSTTIAAGTTSTFSGSIQETSTGLMRMYKEGEGTLVLDGSNTLWEINVDAGTLQYGRTDSLATNTYLFGNGTTLRAGVGGAIATSLVVGQGDVTFDTQHFDVSLADLRGGYDGGALIKTGSGTLEYTGFWTSFYGGVRVNAGTLKGNTSINAFGADFEGASFVNTGAELVLPLSGSTRMNGLTVNGKAYFSPGYQNTVRGTLDGNNGEINGKVRSAGLLDGRLRFFGDVSVAGQHFAGDANVQFIFGSLSYAQATNIVGFSGAPSVEWGLFGNTSTVSGPSGPTAFDRVLVFGNLAFSSATSLGLGFNGLGSTVDWSDAFWSTNRSWTIWEVTGNTTGFGNLTLGTADWQDASGDFLNSIRAGAGFSIGLASNGRDVVLTYTAVPAPGALALMALAGVVGGRRRRG